MAISFTMLAQTAAQSPPAGGQQTQWLIWGLVLLAMAVALFFVEVFLPTGGVIGAAAGLAAVGGVVCLFWRDSTLGLVAATAVVIALPFALAFALQMAPDTPFARWITLKDQQQSVTQGKLKEPPTRSGSVRETSGMIRVGDTGETLTPLFPVGTCLIHGRREECLAKHGTIDVGKPVRVVSVDGSEIYVAVADA